MNYLKQQVRSFLIWLTPIEDPDDTIIKEVRQFSCYLEDTYNDTQITDIIEQLIDNTRSNKRQNIQLLEHEIDRMKTDLKEFNQLIPEVDA